MRKTAELKLIINQRNTQVKTIVSKFNTQRRPSCFMRDPCVYCLYSKSAAFRSFVQNHSNGPCFGALSTPECLQQQFSFSLFQVKQFLSPFLPKSFCDCSLTKNKIYEKWKMIQNLKIQKRVWTRRPAEKKV